MKTELELQTEMYQNIVLAGGSTLFPNIEVRMQNELTRLAPERKVKVICSPERAMSTWFGGSILASMLLDESSISKQEYEECGAKIVNWKCY
jgi:actin-related protein